MKKSTLLIIFTFLSLFVFSSTVFADGNNLNLYPLGQVNTQTQQQSYPVPQYYQNPQPNQYYYQNNSGYNQPQYYYWQQPVQPNSYDQQQWNSYTTLPYSYSEPQNYYYNQEPYYEPNSGLYFYPIDNTQPGPVWPFTPQQSYPSTTNNLVQVSKSWNSDGSISLNWLIRNTTNEDWDRKNIDIKCVSGCYILKNPNQTLWDIPYTVKRNEPLSFTVNIWKPMYNETMTFSIVAGSKTLYTFSVNPN